MAGTSGSFCGPSSIHYYPALEQYSKTIYIFACVINVMGSLSSTLGNIMILSALRKCQSLHSPSKALICSLALTDLVVGLVVLPLFTAYYLTIILEIPTYYCVIAVTYGRLSAFIVGVSLSTIATIAIDRYLAIHLRLRYRELVTLRRVVCVLVAEWIYVALLAGTWFWSVKVNVLSGAVGIFICCLIIILSYLSIYRDLRRHVAQIHQHENVSESSDFNFLSYKKTVKSMLWISGLLIASCIPWLSSMFAILLTGLNNSTCLAMHLSAIALYLNSSLNPVLYCWRIKGLKESVFADLRALCNFFL